MIVFWGIVLAIPELALGGLLLHAPTKTKSLLKALDASTFCAAVLTLIAWLWTAYEVNNIGISAFDTFTKFFPGQVWIMALGLSYLCVIWMRRNLFTRALTGILMLFPASLFRVTRFALPVEGFAPVQILVAFAYIAALIGMYGMFYPWRIEKIVRILIEKVPRIFGGVLVSVGVILIIVGTIS